MHCHWAVQLYWQIASSRIIFASHSLGHYLLHLPSLTNCGSHRISHICCRTDLAMDTNPQSLHCVLSLVPLADGIFLLESKCRVGQIREKVAQVRWRDFLVEGYSCKIFANWLDWSLVVLGALCGPGDNGYHPESFGGWIIWVPP